MSETGQTRHFGRAPFRSGLAQGADIFRILRHVSRVPRTEVDRLFDHLVGEQLHRIGDAQTNRLGSS